MQGLRSACEFSPVCVWSQVLQSPYHCCSCHLAASASEATHICSTRPIQRPCTITPPTHRPTQPPAALHCTEAAAEAHASCCAAGTACCPAIGLLRCRAARPSTHTHTSHGASGFTASHCCISSQLWLHTAATTLLCCGRASLLRVSRLGNHTAHSTAYCFAASYAAGRHCATAASFQSTQQPAFKAHSTSTAYCFAASCAGAFLRLLTTLLVMSVGCCAACGCLSPL